MNKLVLTCYKMLIAVFGLFVGSYANVLIYRIPRGEEWVRTPSHCTGCGKRLRWYHLVPVFSWLALRGRCQYCGGRVSPVYPAVELANGLLWTVCVLVFGLTAFLPAALAVSTALLVLSAIDWKTMEIPDGINLFLLAVGVLWNVYAVFAGPNIWLQNLIGFFCVSLPLLLVSMATKGGVGGGDIKLAAVCGLILGWKNILLALCLGCVIGTAVMLPRHIIKKKGRREQVPFGPFLAAGIFLAMCFGGAIIEAYWSALR